MNLHLDSFAWITPAGRNPAPGALPARSHRTNPFSGQPFRCYEPLEETYADTARLPRLRRSSTISHLAVSAAREAVGSADAAPWSLVFASTDGGIIYTRKFYDQIAEQSPGAGSPLLFPETVHNAPASHIAATLGITGTVLTLSGDRQVGQQALQTAEQLLTAGDCDHCLVVAAQEVDWILCEAYAAWNPDVILAAGSAALVLSLGGDLKIPPLSTEVAAWGDAAGVSLLWQVIYGERLTSSESGR